MTSSRNFVDEFGPILILSSVLIAGYILVHSIMFSEYRYRLIVQDRFDQALAGAKTENDLANEAAMLTKQIMTEPMDRDTFVRVHYRLDELDKIQREHDVYGFARLIRFNPDGVANIISGVDLPTRYNIPSWRHQLKLEFLISWFIVSFCCSIGCLADADFLQRDDSLFDKDNWERWWSYFGIPIVLPVLSIAMAFEVCIRPIKTYQRLHRWIYGERVPATIPAIQNQSSDTSPGQSINKAGASRKTKHPNPELLAEALVKIRKARAQHPRAKAQFIEIYSKSKQEAIAKVLAQKVDGLYSDLTDLGGQIRIKQQLLAEARTGLERQKFLLDHWPENDKAVYDKEWQELLKINRVRAVEVGEDCIDVYTDMLHIPYEGKLYGIGAFQISIPYNAISAAAISMDNLCSTHSQRWHHPYSLKGGTAFCWGPCQVKEAIKKALMAREYAIVIVHVLIALQTADGDNPQRVTEWQDVGYIDETIAKQTVLLQKNHW